ncbi:hypothetical protein [Chamaesiphon sp. VAR_48_metabat_403]|uniref:hypothetical protein n=1 Tax=Chamaesiphon sp. VAR_48_metabat_403 TaxID=2964700 RepID=UPI00286DA2E2|nr:hypothetical protein [Chamaesiphon sp. VAR_48_metabat_403]
MKASILFATGLILAAGAVANPAHAGQGGAAGSISAQFSAGNRIEATAGAVAVGKDSAITTARTTADNISAVAVGSAGDLDVAGLNASEVNYEVFAENNLDTAQGNEFVSAPNLRLGTQGIIIP